MTRWRVDHEIKSDHVLAKDEKQLLFKAPDRSHQIYLITRRGAGIHAADELYLSSHVILDDEDPIKAADKADVYLRQFLETLSIVTNASYQIRKRVMVVDWTPGLTRRGFTYFKNFPNPDVPLYALTHKHIETVTKYSTNPIPLSVRLAMSWWARGVKARLPSEQFQLFWYALEILAEYLKPTAKVSSKCPVCSSDLYCQTCGTIPLHRPYPKQAIKMIVEKHVSNDRDEFFRIIDGSRNKLLHGEDEKTIEKDIGLKWEKLCDMLGQVTWLSLLDTLGRITMETADADTELVLSKTNTFVHYHVATKVNAIMTGNHLDPLNPQIDEFQPQFEWNMIVKEHEKKEQEQQDA